MEKMNDLRDLLHHEVLDLTSAEEQIIAALPKMIEKATNAGLKKALKNHLTVTQAQRKRLEKVHQLLHKGKTPKEEKGGLLAKLFGGENHKCKGTQGIIEEGEKIMKEEMNPEVMDAAIIASAQKIEHYEICGYGTARAFAEELGLREVADLLYQTLNEEYEADDILTEMAVNRLNKEAEIAGKKATGKGNENAGKEKGSKQVGGKTTAKAATSKNTALQNAVSKTPAAKTKAAGKTATTNGGKRAPAKKSR